MDYYLNTKIAVVFSIVLLCGCATTSGSNADLSEIPKGRGIVLFSTGADKTNGTQSTGLSLVQAQTRKMYDKIVINIDSPFFTSNFPNEHAHVRSLILPEGDYFLILKSGNPAFCLIIYPTYFFSVKEGNITYIGSFQLSSNQLTLTQSNRARDIEYFQQKNQKLMTKDIASQIPIVSSEKYDYCSPGHSFVKGIIWDLP